MISKNRFFILSNLFLICSLCSIAQTNQGWTLRECIDHAIKNNLSIQHRKNDIESSRIIIESKKWARVPNLNALTKQSWEWAREKSKESTQYTNIKDGQTHFSIETSIPLFSGFSLPNQLKQSKLNFKAAMEDLNEAKEDLSINVTSLYLQVLLNKELEKIAKQEVDLSKEQLNRILDIKDKSYPNLEILIANLKAHLAEEELYYTQTQNNSSLALLDLSQLLELESPDNFFIYPPSDNMTFYPLNTPGEIYNKALTYKPEILAAQYRLESSSKDIKIAQSAYYPEVFLGAGLESNFYTHNRKASKNFKFQFRDNLNKYVEFKVRIPLFNRLETNHRVKLARIYNNNVSINLEIRKKTLYKEIQQAWYNAVASAKRYESSNATVTANEVSFKLMTEKFISGEIKSIDYNRAKFDLTKARSQRIQDKYEYLFRTKILDFYKGIPIE